METTLAPVQQQGWGTASLKLVLAKQSGGPREDLLKAVYLTEVEKLARAACELFETLPPVAAGGVVPPPA